jgi:hypothetical protein
VVGGAKFGEVATRATADRDEVTDQKVSLGNDDDPESKSSEKPQYSNISIERTNHDVH